MADKAIRQRAYEAFQMYWMSTHHITISDISKAVAEYISDSGGTPDAPFSSYLEEVGFMGVIWPCYHEFLDNEYLDSDLMKTLLGYKGFQEYLSDRSSSD